MIDGRHIWMTFSESQNFAPHYTADPRITHDNMEIARPGRGKDRYIDFNFVQKFMYFAAFICVLWHISPCVKGEFGILCTLVKNQ